ncbi:MAG: transporter, partial [Phycisphaerae bacterium]
LGLRRPTALLLVELPQAIRIATPPLINELVSTLKTTSLAMAISLREMMTITTFAISSTFRFLEWYGAALVWYLALVSAVMIVQALVERRMGRAFATTLGPRSGA